MKLILKLFFSSSDVRVQNHCWVHNSLENLTLSSVSSSPRSFPNLTDLSVPPWLSRRRRWIRKMRLQCLNNFLVWSTDGLRHMLRRQARQYPCSTTQGEIYAQFKVKSHEFTIYSVKFNRLIRNQHRCIRLDYGLKNSHFEQKIVLNN